MTKRNNLIAIGLGLVQLAFSNAQVFAQRQDTTSLNQVVVTATRSPKKIADIGKIVKVISSEEIQKAQGRSLPELLNTVAGLIVTGSGSNPGEVQSVYLRGASSANTLILIDGISVNDASGISGEFNIAAIAIDQIERIEILKGASSTLYGSDAVAGVINIITKKGNGKLAANALLTGGSYGTFKQAVGLNGLVNKTKIGVNLSHLYSKGFSTAQPSNNENFERDNFSQSALGLNISQFVTDKITLNAGFQGNINNANLDDGAFSDLSGYTYKKTSTLANLGAKIELDKGSLNLVFSQNEVKNKFDNNSSITDNKGNITNTEGIFTYQFNKNLGITSGANYKFSKTDQINDYGTLSSDSAKNSISSLYTSVFIKGGDFFRLEVGGRFNSHNQFGENFTYTFNPSLIISQQFKYYINISSAYRTPSLYQFTSEYGNRALKPENSQNYETGLEGSFLNNQLTFSSAFFVRQIDNVIDFGLINPTKFAYLNQNKQNDKGFELELGFKPNEKLNLNLFYAFVDGNVQASDNAIKTFNLFRRPKNSVGANLGYTISKKTFIALNYRWNDLRKDQYFDVKTFKVIAADLKAYSKLDVYLQFKTSNKLTIFADVKNIFDANYNDFAGYTTKGINFNTGISFNFH